MASPCSRPPASPTATGLATCRFPLLNTGRAAPPAGDHPEDVRGFLGGDVYRVSASAGSGWEISVPNQLATAEFGRLTQVPVYAKRTGQGPLLGRVTLTATSESDPTKRSTAACTVVGR